LLHADHIVAHAETYCGLVEAGVGLVPAWGGCKEFLLRQREREAAEVRRNTGGRQLWFAPEDSPMRAPRTAFETIGVGTAAKSAVEARKIGFLREADSIVMNRDRLLYQARAKVVELAQDYQPPEKPEALRLPGPSGKAAMDLAVQDMHKAGTATDYDCVVADALAYVLSGGEMADYPTHPLSEDDLLRLEREQFMLLVKNEGTMARIEYMLENNKPLRN
jgi:3-hydroxyacyl-CoA dehydrogenase